mmetsp:Transcript_138280/g.441902  ORF Transcript_138280/g.441902 Transcript_138280/m.441902 type:complete len:244 (+) Transcript_138280:756-1487(+)
MAARRSSEATRRVWETSGWWCFPAVVCCALSSIAKSFPGSHLPGRPSWDSRMLCCERWSRTLRAATRRSRRFCRRRAHLLQPIAGRCSWCNSSSKATSRPTSHSSVALLPAAVPPRNAKSAWKSPSTTSCTTSNVRRSVAAGALGACKSDGFGGLLPSGSCSSARSRASLSPTTDVPAGAIQERTWRSRTARNTPLPGSTTSLKSPRLGVWPRRTVGPPSYASARSKAREDDEDAESSSSTPR